MDAIINTLDQDRRSTLRHTVKTALRIRAWKTAVPEHRAESINVSLRGIYFSTKTPLCEGEIVEVLLKMPEEVTGEPATEWRCTGHVVRVEQADSQTGEVGVGVQFYFYEASRPEHRELPVSAGSLWRMLPQHYEIKQRERGCERQTGNLQAGGQARPTNARAS